MGLEDKNVLSYRAVVNIVKGRENEESLPMSQRDDKRNVGKREKGKLLRLKLARKKKL